MKKSQNSLSKGASFSEATKVRIQKSEKVSLLKNIVAFLFMIPAFLLFVICASQLIASRVDAASGVNHTINFQGKVVNKTGGTNITDGNYTFVFKIYDSSSGGTKLWGDETQSSVPVTSGIFQVALGSVRSFATDSLNFNQDNLWLDVTFNGETFGSRIRLAAVPYALSAESVAGLTVTNNGGNTLNIAASKTVVVSNSLTFAGTDSTTMTFPSTTTTVAGLSIAQTFINAQTITPVQNSISALTVNGTSGTAATALNLTQAGAADGLDVNLTNTSATQTNGLLLKRNGASGTTTNGIQVVNSAGVLTTGILIDDGASGATITDGLKVTNSAGTAITNGITIGSGSQAITTGINLASTGITTDIVLQNGETIDNDTNGQVQISANSGTITLHLNAASGSTPVISANAGADSNVGLTINTKGTGTLTLDSIGAGEVDVAPANATVIKVGTGNTASTISFGTGTGANTLNIGTGNTLTGLTQAINIGSGIPAGSGLTNITIGNTVNGGTLSLRAGSGGIILTNASTKALVVGANGLVNPVFNIDASAASVATGLQVKGAATGGTTALSVIDAGSNASLSIDAKGSGTITIGGTSTGNTILGGTTNGLTFSTTSGPSYSGTGRPIKQIVLSPEYTGGVITAFYGAGTDSNISGNMTSDTDTTEGTSIRNYYSWTASSGTQQFYTVAVRVTLPPDFSAWASSNALTVAYITQSATSSNSLVDVRVYNENSASVVVSSTSNALTSWTTASFAGSSLSGWATAGNVAVIYLRMGSASSNYVHIGDITLNYLGSY